MCRKLKNILDLAIIFLFSCCYQECSLQNIIRPVFKSRPITMHSLVELWALLAMLLSKIFDQVGGSEWSADVGLFNFEGREQGLED